MSDPASAYPDDTARLSAIRRRDRAADGHFLYSVRTTGVFCHPSCAARPALDRHVAFHPDAAAAERAGFRACRRCRPDLPPRAERDAALVAAACRMIEAAETPPSLASLALAAGCSMSHFHRLFRRVTGVTQGAYAAAHRQARVQAGLADGAPVTRAVFEAGFNSTGPFYAAADAMLGMTPGRYRKGAPGETIRHAIGVSDLGSVLVAATGRGLCAILLGDDPAALRSDLARRFPHATLIEAEPAFGAWVDQVVRHVEQPRAGLALPLDIRGTAFQRRVWALLQDIPPGETRTYKQVAHGLGQASAPRAVASACAANALAVVVPCHRVIAGTGALTGYRWGVDRKRALLARERP